MKNKGLSIKELADYLGVSTDTIRRAARAGQLPFARVGTAYRFNLRQVHAAMDHQARERFPSGTAGAPGGKCRPRASQNAPEQVTRGLG